MYISVIYKLINFLLKKILFLLQNDVNQIIKIKIYFLLLS